MITGALLTPSQLFFRYIHGQRVAFAGRGRSGTDVVVFDFSLAAVLSVKGCIPAPSAPSWELSSSTLIDSSRECPFFVDDFSTYLPYVHITRDIKLKWSDILFCADGLVCMKDVQVRSKLPSYSNSVRTCRGWPPIINIFQFSRRPFFCAFTEVMLICHSITDIIFYRLMMAIALPHMYMVFNQINGLDFNLE
jgi:hypothetical protein